MPGIYIHIPFCKQRCHYCDFHFSTSLKNKTALLKALVSEMKLKSDFFKGTKINTIYLGGGTPSLLTNDEINNLFDALNQYFDLSDIDEITIEANPDDLNKEKIKALKTSPINRFSIGVQSFQAQDLIYMNRAHDVEQAKNSIQNVQQAGWQNITIDLIYGTPTLSNQQWQENLQYIIDFNIPHLSAYGLTVEEKTPLHHAIKTGQQKALDEKKSLKQFEMLMNFMPKQGLEQYEISNFSKKGFQAKHNGSYWNEEPYLGLGPSAHSFDGKRRLWNIANNQSYIKSINEGQSNYRFEILSQEQRYNEYIMTALRTSRGCNLNELNSRFAPFLSHFFQLNIKKWQKTEHIEQNKTIFKLTKKGKLIADWITSDLFFVEN